MELSDAISRRRSIRRFTGEDISEGTVRLLLDAARLAPSGSNLQPARFVVVKSAEARAALARLTPYKFIAKAAAVFVCCADLKAITARGKQIEELVKEGVFEGVEMDATPGTYAPQMDDRAIKAYLSMNVAIAIEHIALKAVDLGLGSCWIGRFEYDKVKEYLSLDETIHPVVFLPVGHPAQAPKPRPRFDLEKYVLKTI